MTTRHGQPLVFPDYTGRVWPSYNNPLFLETIYDCQHLLNSSSCQIIHQGRNRLGIVSLPQREGRQVEIVIKEFKPQGVDRWKSLFLPSKASKAWTGACLLLTRKVSTPFPVAYLEQRRRFFVDTCYYLCEKVSEAEEIRFLFRKLLPPELKAMLTALASFLTDCHKKGIFHRDLSDGNILVKRNDNKKYEFYLIDTNRIRLRKHMPLWVKLKNLVRLGVPPSFQRFFLSQYLGSSNLNNCRWQWYRLNKQCFSWYIKFKKKLRLRPLARKLKIQ